MAVIPSQHALVFVGVFPVRCPLHPPIPSLYVTNSTSDNSVTKSHRMIDGSLPSLWFSKKGGLNACNCCFAGSPSSSGLNYKFLQPKQLQAAVILCNRSSYRISETSKLPHQNESEALPQSYRTSSVVSVTFSNRTLLCVLARTQQLGVGWLNSICSSLIFKYAPLAMAAQQHAEGEKTKLQPVHSGWQANARPYQTNN